MSRKAIIGYTGFVGSHIKDHLELPFDLYNSKNIHEIHEKEYDIVYMAGLPATKWMINKEPEKDMLNMMKLQQHLAKSKFHTIVLISTIDIYDKNKQLQDEDVTKVTEEAYGKHRFIMEEWVKLNYPESYYIVRLPALFGVGLKKNIIYDMMNNNNVASINPYTFFQWYDMSHLMSDINYALTHNIRTLNLFSEPIWTLDMIRNCFPQLAQVVIKNNSPSTNIYNYRTKYSPSLNGYAYPNKELIFDNLKRYVKLQTKINNVQDRLIVSNLAWDTVWEDHALDILTKYGITGVELAVTKYTPWDKINREVLLNIKDRFAKRGIAIHSLQAIFFGVIDNVFTEETTFTEHFKTVIMCAGVLGAKRIVFGSPRNRVKPDNMPLDYADANFINVMRKLAIYARTYDVIICLEPNAVEYKCNYITHIDHAIHIVKSVDHANLKLNFDTGNALMSGELSVEKFMEVAPYVGHIQVSLPFLDELRKLSDYDEIHRALSDAFKKQECFVSLEMKQVAKYNQFIENISKFVWLYA